MPHLYASPKRILVTGGAELLGFHLIDRLLEKRHEVAVHPQSVYRRQTYMEDIYAHPRFEFMTFPVHYEVDEIYNLACPASPIHYQHDPVQTARTSVHRAINMLGLAKQVKCRVLRGSTSEVCGDPAIPPQAQNCWGNVNPIGPRSGRDEGQRCDQTIFFDYNSQHSFEIRVARIFITHGRRAHLADGRVVSNFIVQALKASRFHLMAMAIKSDPSVSSEI